MKIEYALTNDQRAVMEPLIQRCLPIIPPEFTRMMVKYAEPEGHLLQITTRTEYRTILIEAGDVFFGYGKEDQALSVVHEVTHIFIDPLRTSFEEILEALTEEGAFRTAAWSRWNQFEERVVCDVAHLLHQVLEKKDASSS
jgi:hypothetical protein